MIHLPPQTVEALLESLNCGAMLLDRSGRILIANRRLIDMMKTPLPCLRERRFEDIYDDEKDRRRVQERMAEFGEAREGEFYLPRVDGTHLPVILSSRPLGDGEPLSNYMVVTAIDISKQKAAEARLSEDYHTIAQLSDTVLTQALDLKHYSEDLEQMVRDRTEEIREANMEAITMLAVACETRDEDTGSHVLRIQRYTEQLARELRLPETDVERFGYSAILHDVGKIVVPDDILKKPGLLTLEEREIMQRHAPEGERILSSKPFFDTARAIARSHHENWDGSGYPDGAKGEAIPLAARIVHVADVFDALTSRRVYKPAWSREDAARAIREGAGRMFDPSVVAAFDSLMRNGGLEADDTRLSVDMSSDTGASS
ncbi:MAG TPA: HD domain-containing protein [Phycisphaerae bacterium]|nr:HD domain-containing protein [Phycisphaerae bacterium]HRW51753.1 HD domain-containing protein [Phycisphaerae bacterium]